MQKLKIVRPTRRRLFENVADTIRQAILRNEYKIGDKLPSEGELAELFGVSRIVVREAIRYLEHTGLLIIRQGATGGAFVSEMNTKMLQDYMRDLLDFKSLSAVQLAEVRIRIDPDIARIAAIRATDDDLESIQRSIQENDPPKTVDEVYAVEHEFHQSLARSSHNLFYVAIEGCVSELIRAFVKLVKPKEKIIGDHKAHLKVYKSIFEQIKNKNAAEAETIMTRHVKMVSNELIQYEKEYFEKRKIE